MHKQICLEKSHVMYQLFRECYFTVLLKQGDIFNQIAVAKIPEATINNDTQIARWTKCFSIRLDAVSHCYLAPLV